MYTNPSLLASVSLESCSLARKRARTLQTSMNSESNQGFKTATQIQINLPFFPVLAAFPSLGASHGLNPPALNLPLAATPQGASECWEWV